MVYLGAASAPLDQEVLGRKLDMNQQREVRIRILLGTIKDGKNNYVLSAHCVPGFVTSTYIIQIQSGLLFLIFS